MARDCPPVAVDFLGLGAGGHSRDMVLTARELVQKSDANGHGPAAGGRRNPVPPTGVVLANGSGTGLGGGAVVGEDGSLCAYQHLKEYGGARCRGRGGGEGGGGGGGGGGGMASRHGMLHEDCVRLPPSLSPGRDNDPPPQRPFFAKHWLPQSVCTSKSDGGALAADEEIGGCEDVGRGCCLKDEDRDEDKEGRKRSFAAMGDGVGEKPLEELTDVDIQQLTREECRKYLKQKGMRKPSWNKAQVTHQLLSLKTILPLAVDSKLGDRMSVSPTFFGNAVKHRGEPLPNPEQSPMPPTPPSEAAKYRPNGKDMDRVPDRLSYACTMRAGTDGRGLQNGRAGSSSVNAAPVMNTVSNSPIDEGPLHEQVDPLLSLSMRVNDDSGLLRVSQSSGERSVLPTPQTPRQPTPPCVVQATAPSPPCTAAMGATTAPPRVPPPVSVPVPAAPPPACPAPMQLPVAASANSMSHSAAPSPRPSSMPAQDGRQRVAQLTIFYDGLVNVYDHVPSDKAKAIMLLAGESTSWSTSSLVPSNTSPSSVPVATQVNGSGVAGGPQCNPNPGQAHGTGSKQPHVPAIPSPCPPPMNPPSASMLLQQQQHARRVMPPQPQSGHIPGNSTMQIPSPMQPVPPVPAAIPSAASGNIQKAQARMVPQHPSVSRIQAMPMARLTAKEPSQARKASLARFLEKRKERMRGRSTKRWAQAENNNSSPPRQKSPSSSSPSSSRGQPVQTLSAHEEISSSPPPGVLSPVTESLSPAPSGSTPQKLGSSVSAQQPSAEVPKPSSPSSSRSVIPAVLRDDCSQDSSPVTGEEKKWAGKQMSDSTAGASEGTLPRAK